MSHRQYTIALCIAALITHQACDEAPLGKPKESIRSAIDVCMAMLLAAIKTG